MIFGLPPISSPAIAFRKVFFPVQRVAHDDVEIIVSWLPAKQGSGHIGFCDDFRGITGPPLRLPHGKIDAGDPFDRLDHLQHRCAVTVAAIQDSALTAGAQVIESQPVRRDKIADMDVIADTGTVARRVVASKDDKLVALAPAPAPGSYRAPSRAPHRAG